MLTLCAAQVRAVHEDEAPGLRMREAKWTGQQAQTEKRYPNLDFVRKKLIEKIIGKSNSFLYQHLE